MEMIEEKWCNALIPLIFDHRLWIVIVNNNNNNARAYDKRSSRRKKKVTTNDGRMFVRYRIRLFVSNRTLS